MEKLADHLGYLIINEDGAITSVSIFQIMPEYFAIITLEIAT